MRVRRPTRVEVFALLLAWAFVAGAAVVVGLTRVEQGISADGAEALANADIAVDRLIVEGRDVYLAGPADLKTDAVAAFAGVDGVRAVHWTDSAVVRRAPDPEPPTTTAPPSTDPPTRATTTTVPPPEVAQLTATLRAGKLTVDGVVPDAEAAARLAFVADLVYAPFLENNVVVDESVAPASWVGHAADLIAVLPIVGTSSFELRGEEGWIVALAPDERRSKQLQGALAAAAGPEVAFTADITVTGLEPPVVEAEAPGDGTLHLDGIVPSEAIEELLVGTAVKVYGADNVVNRLEVREGIDTTFSLFRLPLTFPLFQPMPQWHVRIADDVITGNLRGGATFPVGSAKLTPQLEALMPIAAGILSRNPTLVMTVEGHSDSVGSEDDNMALSRKRAQAAVDWLIAAGIAPERLFAVGYGESRPIGDNSTSEGRALNRRIEFRLGPPDAEGGES